MPDTGADKAGTASEFRLARTVIQASGAAALLMVVGTFGYHHLEGWSLFNAFYMTVITLSTVGYGELQPLSTAGRSLSIVLILGGVGTLGYAIGATTEFLAQGGWTSFRRRRRMQEALATISGHTIVCGYGRCGHAVVEVLRSNGHRVVVIDQNAAALAKLPEDPDLLHIAGDAQDDAVLTAAGVTRATAMVAAVNSDASNVFLTLSAREMNPTIKLYGKAEDPHTLKKLQRAGADHVFSPAAVAGHRVGWQIVQPDVTNLLDIVTRKGDYELNVEELQAADVLLPEGTVLKQTKLWGAPGKMIVAVKRQDDTVVFPPRAETTLTAGDRVVVLIQRA